MLGAFRAVNGGAGFPALASAVFQQQFASLANKRYDCGERSVRQKRIASEVMHTVSHALQQGRCKSDILSQSGFEITDVKMSSDLRSAHILWKALPDMSASAEKAVLRHVKYLRSLVFTRLSLPFSPVLRFQEDVPPAHVTALNEALARLKKESEADKPADSFELNATEQTDALGDLDANSPR